MFFTHTQKNWVIKSETVFGRIFTQLWNDKTWSITFYLCYQAENGSYQKMGANKPINILFFIKKEKKKNQ